MRTIVRIDTQGKVRPIRRRALDAIPAVEAQASLVALIQAVIPFGLKPESSRAGLDFDIFTRAEASQRPGRGSICPIPAS